MIGLGGLGPISQKPRKVLHLESHYYTCGKISSLYRAVLLTYNVFLI